MMLRKPPRIAARAVALAAVAAVATYARYATQRTARLDECMDRAHHGMHMGDLDACERAYRDALAIDERYLPARTGLADVFDMRGQDEQALAENRLGIEADARNPDAHLALARALMEYHRYREALVPLKEAARLAPRDVHTRLLLASMYRRLGDTGAAKRELAAIEEIKPGTPMTMNARLAMARDAQRASTRPAGKAAQQSPREPARKRAQNAGQRSAAEHTPAR